MRVCRHWWSKALWAFWPLLITWVVIVTANHYWVDAALGWMVALASALIAHRAARPRPARSLVLAQSRPAGGRGVAAACPSGSLRDD